MAAALRQRRTPSPSTTGTIPAGHYSMVFIEFEAMPPSDPDAAEATTFTEKLGKIFDEKIRPFRHARLIVLDPYPYSKKELSEGDWEVHADSKGRAFDCDGSKADPELAAKQSSEWVNGKRKYEADAEFLGFTTLPASRISGVTKRLVEKKKTYKLLTENCWHFAVDLAFEVLSKDSGVFNKFTQMPGGLKEYPLLAPDE